MASMKRTRLDAERASRDVWLLKVPPFVLLQWQNLPLLEERDRVHRPAVSALINIVAATIRELMKNQKLNADLALSTESVERNTMAWKRAEAARTDFKAALGNVAASQAFPDPPDIDSSDPLSRHLLALRRLLRTEVVLALAEASLPAGALASDDRFKSFGEKKAEGDFLARQLPSASAVVQAALGNNFRKLAALANATDGSLEKAIRVAIEDEVQKAVPKVAVLDGSLSKRFKRDAALQQIEASSAGPVAEAHLGTLRTFVDPVAPSGEASRSYALRIPGDLSNIPCEYVLAPQPGLSQVEFVVLGEAQADGGAPTSIKGTVAAKLDMSARDPNDERYRAVSRARAAKYSVHTRVLVTVDSKETPMSAPLPARINAQRAAQDKAKAAKGITAGGKRERTPKDGPNGLIARLFTLFEQRAYWRVIDLETRTGEPLAWLKEVLGEIAELHNKGPTKGYYALKKEYQRVVPAKQEPGGGGAAAATGAGVMKRE